MDALEDSRLDPKVRWLLGEMKTQNRPPLEDLPPAEARVAAVAGLSLVAGEAWPVARVENREVPGPLGPIPIRVYMPEGDAPRACMVYYHGGGWVVCDLDSHDTVCRLIAHEASAVVVAVDYRLAPEHKFPAAVTDCHAATQWVFDNAARLGVDPLRISVGGDSAGGNLAAVLSLRARDESGPRIASQILVYPVTNLSSFDTASYQEFAEGYHLSRSVMVWFRDHYMASAEDGKHPHASPLLVEDLRGLPPALVITAECDVLRDEGEAYAHRLKDAGVPVTLVRYGGMVHPFFSMPGLLEQSRVAIAQVAQFVAKGRVAG